MKVIAISGDGMGAGKTFLAKSVTQPELIISLADRIRHDLSWYYPNYDWYNKTQEYKDTKIVTETGKTIRNMLLTYGADKRAIDPDYWINSVICEINRIYDEHTSNTVEPVFAIDDVRYLNEIDKLRSAFGKSLTHIHVSSNLAKEEPFQNKELRAIATYIIKGKDHA